MPSTRHVSTTVRPQSIENSSLLAANTFGSIAQSRTWDWLAGLCRPFNVDLQLIDVDHVAGVMHAPAAGRTEISRLFESRSPALRAAIAATVRTGEPQATTVDGVQFVTAGVRSGPGALGVLVVARELPSGLGTVQRTRADLDAVAQWLCPGIEAHLAGGPSLDGKALEKLSSLGMLLASAAAHASDRDTVAAFAETLAIWHDVNMYGYVETEDGTFVPEVMLPDVDAGTVPPVISPTMLPDNVEGTRLARVDARTLGFTAEGDMFAARFPVAGGGRAWLLLLSGPVAPEHLARLRLYVSLLEQWIRHAAAASVMRVVTELASSFLDDDQARDTSGVRALAQLVNTLSMASAEWTVTAADGASLMRLVEHGGRQRNGGNSDAPCEIQCSSGDQVMTLAVAPVAGRHVTPQERQALHAAAELMAQWSRRVLPHRRRLERRAASPQFEGIIESIARQSVEGGIGVSLIMLSLDPAAASAGVALRWVREIRTHLRPADLVGLLAEREIAVLLRDACDQQAQTVARRLQNLLIVDAAATTAPPPLGFASWAPGDSLPGALVQQARQKAYDQNVA